MVLPESAYCGVYGDNYKRPIVIPTEPKEIAGKDETKEPDNIKPCSSYIKKIIDEASTSEDTILLIQFLCWEYWEFTSSVLYEILTHIGYSYTPELKTFLELLISLLKIEDSWQMKRITYSLKGTGKVKGFPDDKDGLIDIIHRNKTSHPKRAYLFIKSVTNLMEPNGMAHRVITATPDLMRKWSAAVDWLQHELERRAPTAGSSYGYSATSWSPPSNESANGSFFLERSLSAKTTLERAIELRIYPELGDNDEDQISSEGEEEGGKVTRDAYTVPLEGDFGPLGVRRPAAKRCDSNKLPSFSAKPTSSRRERRDDEIDAWSVPPNTPPSSSESLQINDELSSNTTNLNSLSPSRVEVGEPSTPVSLTSCSLSAVPMAVPFQSAVTTSTTFSTSICSVRPSSAAGSPSKTNAGGGGGGANSVSLNLQGINMRKPRRGQLSGYKAWSNVSESPPSPEKDKEVN
jgi:hypothetical protein